MSTKTELDEIFEYRDNEDFVRRTNIEWRALLFICFWIAFIVMYLLATLFNKVYGTL